MTDTQPSDFLPFDFVYAGQRAAQGGKPGAEIYKIIDGQLSESYVFAAKSLKGKVLGGMYRGAEFSPDKARGIGSAKYIGRWQVQTDCIIWRAREEAFEAEQRISKLQADAKKVNEIEDIMLPLRKMYATYTRQYDHAGKEALEQAVLRALRSPPRKSEAD